MKHAVFLYVRIKIKALTHTGWRQQLKAADGLELYRRNVSTYSWYTRHLYIDDLIKTYQKSCLYIAHLASCMKKSGSIYGDHQLHTCYNAHLEFVMRQDNREHLQNFKLQRVWLKHTNIRCKHAEMNFQS